METLRILLDTPSSKPALGFDATSVALAQLIEQSEPRFAVGIFGSWGSGKTTLMQAIKSELNREDTLKVFFNAWRYEREPHLIVPLLDAIRAALMEWSAAAPADMRERIAEIAGKIGRVVRALASGLSAEISLPGGIAKLSYDVGHVVEGMSQDTSPTSAQSLYFAGFEQLREAFERLAEDGIARIVVFIDDLDRCLPSSALDVIESMKLFFDLPGFVFVVGLDQFVLEQAVRSRIANTLNTVPEVNHFAGGRVRLAEREYAKKIFQVPYELPPMAAEQLDALLASIYETANLPDRQLDDLRGRVRRYLAHIAVDGHINPREVKRFVNAYTLQVLIRPNLDRDTILAVQTLAFRDDWPLYATLRAETSALPEAIGRYRAGENSALADLWPDIGALPTDLVRFLRSEQAAALAGNDLRAYVTSADSTVRTERWIGEAYTTVGRLRRVARPVVTLVGQPNAAQSIAQLSHELSQCIDQLAVLVTTTTVPAADRLSGYLADLRNSAASKLHGAMSIEAASAWLRSSDAVIDEIQRELRLLRGMSFVQA